MKTKQERMAYWAFLIVIGISIIALAGWFAHTLSLASIGQNFIPMAPVAAILFIALGGVSLHFLTKKEKSRFIKMVLLILLIFNGLVLFDSLMGYPIAVEQYFSNSTGTFRNFPVGRMSPFTTVLFLTGLISLFLITSGDKRFIKLSLLLCSLGMFLAFILDLGYLYGTPLLYNRGIIPPALNTSVAFTFLFSGMLFGFGMNELPMNLFVGESVRARLMRNFLPFTLFIIVVAGWIDTIFFHFYDDHVLVSAIVTLFSIFVLTVLILSLSKEIGNNIDQAFDMLEETKAALGESELHFRTLADSGQALIWTSGLDKQCSYFNQPWLDFTGRRLEQEYGNGWMEGIYPDDRKRCIETYNTAFDRQEKFSLDFRLCFHDGTYRWIQDNGTPRYNIDGKFIGYIGHCLDITDRKLTVEALVESEERYRLISSVSTDYTFSTKVMPDGTLDLDWVAGAFESISGYSVEEFKERGAWRASIYPEDLHIDDNDIARLRNNQDTESQIRTINRKGEIVWVQVFAHPLWDEQKNGLSGIYGAVRNITEQKQAEEVHLNSERRFRELLEKVNLLAVLLDEKGKITFVNDFLMALTGYKREELIGNDWFNLMIPEPFPEVKEVFLSGIKDEKSYPHFENPIKTKLGKLLDIVWSNSILRNPDGQVIGVASIGEDITERKIAQDQIIRLNNELEQKVKDRTAELENRTHQLSDNQKELLNLVADLNEKSGELTRKTEQLQVANKELEAFSYSVSHDLKAPLRAIHGFIKIFQEEYLDLLDDEGKRLCNVIESNALRMGQLINDLLSFSRLIRSEIRQSSVDMESVAKQVFADLAPDFQDKKISLNLKPLPVAVCDLNLIRQVWVNLISNALKYSSRNTEIVVSIGAERKENEIVYFISDNGIGFDMQYAHKLFGVFQRLHNLKEFEGTGVGLAIVQRIIFRHHGRVWADAEIGKGATFYFALPDLKGSGPEI